MGFPLLDWLINAFGPILLSKSNEDLFGNSKNSSFIPKIKDIYAALYDKTKTRGNFSWISKSPFSLKVILFLWKAMGNALLTITNLIRRGIQVNKGCPRCADLNEDAIHALHGCSCIKSIILEWETCQVQFLVMKVFSFELKEIVDY